MGRNVEEALLKSKDQMIFGIKKIKGHLNASSLIIDSNVNDINMIQLINNQVKKYKTIQKIETKMDFRSDLEIFGNVVINGFYQGVNLVNISNHNELDVILNKATKIMELAKDIEIVLHSKL